MSMPLRFDWQLLKKILLSAAIVCLVSTVMIAVVSQVPLWQAFFEGSIITLIIVPGYQYYKRSAGS